MKIVIRAGGSGTRLWPLSRRKNPKQFLPLLGEHSLLRQKYDEIKPLLKSPKDLFVSIGPGFVPTVRHILPRIPKENIIVEPVSRNTGPAIGLESVLIQKIAKEDDPVIASLTVDDVFTNVEKFRNLLRASEKLLHEKPFYALAVAAQAGKPDTGLSYIELGKSIGKVYGQSFHLAKRWVEKPKMPMLNRIIRNPKFFAHTGQYIWKNSTIVSYFESFQPLMTSRLRKISSAHGGRSYQRVLSREYAALPSLSIEEAIAQYVEQMGVVSGKLGWSDTGKWYLIHDLLQGGALQNASRGKTIFHDVKNTLVFSDSGRLVAGVGLRDMVVVDTKDAVLVVPKEASAQVKDLVEQLKARSLDRYL